MVEFDPDWQAYFDELDPRLRLVRFNILARRQEEQTGFCRSIYEQRYTDPRHPDRPVDTWLWKIVYLPGLYRRRKMLKKALRREMEQTARELHLTDPSALSDLERGVLYQEFRNTARRYLSTCRGSRYGRKLMGLKPATPQEQRDRACEEIWTASRGLAREAGMEENFALWTDALRAELAEYDPEYWHHYEELDRRAGK